MSDQQPPINLDEAHRYFSADCFNRAWEYIEKYDRTAEDDEMMRMLAHAAVWHWSQRSDRADKNVSIGFWQLSRVYALLNKQEESFGYANKSLAAAERGHLDPFYFGYAYEALARAAHIAGDRSARDVYLTQARKFAEQVTDLEDLQFLTADLNQFSE